MENDLRDWLKKANQVGELTVIEGADWDIEIGCLTALNAAKSKGGTALLFDNIKGYPKGYRVATGATLNSRTLALTLNLPTSYSDRELVAVVHKKFSEWRNRTEEFPPEMVTTAPFLENVHSGEDIDLFEFPVPKWHDLDGGRYIGSGHGVITRDPASEEVNLGCYRVMVHDKKTTGLFMHPDRHGTMHMKKYHERGEPCPVAVTIGHHPLMLRTATLQVPPNAEYGFAGAVRGEPVKVINEEVTGLPVPADSEIVIAGWIPPEEVREEGPFGEWSGYYASAKAPEPIIQVERIYHRNDPIILAAPPCAPRSEGLYFTQIVRGALLRDQLANCGIPDIKGVWISEAGSSQLMIVSIKQRYVGHSNQAATILSMLPQHAVGRYVIVVDEDIDITNITEVLWALCTRADPLNDIHILRRAPSGGTDPLIRKPATHFSNTRAVIDACKPYEWINNFPKDIKIGPELAEEMRKKWGSVLKF